MNEIKALTSKLESALQKDIFSGKQELKKVFDFKEKEKEYYSRDIINLIKKIKDDLIKTPFTAGNKKIIDALEIIKTVEKLLENKTKESLKKSISMLKEIKLETKSLNTKLVLPSLPKEIESEIKSNFHEIEVCFDNSCYRSVLILCGKVLEIALHRKFFEMTGKDMLEKAPDLGLGNLTKKMKDDGIEIDPGLGNQIHLINQLRIHSVHKKSIPFEPSKDQTQATILYTLDTLNKLFK